MAVVDLSVRDAMSAGVQAATASLNKLADAADKATGSATTLSSTTSAALPNFTALNQKLDESAGLAARVEAANRKYEASLASLRAEASKNAEVATNLNTLEQNAAADRDIAITKATAQSAALKSNRDAQLAANEAQASGIAPTKALAQASNEGSISAGSQAFATRNLSIQLTQAFSSIASGQPVFTTLIQQGHGVTDVMESTGQGVAGLAQSFGSLFTKIGGWPTVALAAFGLGIYSVVSHSIELETESRTLQTAIDGVGHSANVSAGQLLGYATQLQRNSELSKTQAVDAVAAQQRTPGITAGNIQQINAIAPDVGVALGIGTASAITQLTDAYTGNYAAIQKLMTASNDFSLAQVTQVREFLAQGDKASALKIVVDQLGTSMDKARVNSLSPMDVEMKNLGNSWQNFIDVVSKSAPVALIMDQFRKNVATYADALAVSNVEVADSVKPLLLEYQKLQALQQTVHDTNSSGNATPAFLQDQLAAQQAKVDAMVAERRANAPPAAAVSPAAGTNSATSSPQMTTAQAQAYDALNKSIDDQNKLLATSLPLRAGVAAAQKADADQLNNQLPAAEAAIVKQKAIAAAVAQASDAYVQASASADRQVVATNKLADATDQGRAAAELAAAAAIAQEKAATQAGVSIAAETQRQLDLKAANEAVAVSQANSGLKESVEAQTNLAEATDLTSYHTQELNNTVQNLVKSYQAAAAATNDPKIIANYQLRVSATKDLVFYSDQQTKAAQATHDLLVGEQELQYLQAETDTLGQADDVRARTLAKLREQQQIDQTLSGLSTDQKNALIAQAGAIADATTALQTQQAAYAEVSNFANQEFSNLGQTISNAFTTGGVIKWGDVVKQVIADILQEALKLAIINPLIKSLGGVSSIATLSSVSSALGGGTTTTSSDGGLSLSSVSSYLGLGSSTSGALGGPTFGSLAGQASEYVGLTGQGGLLSSAANNGIISTYLNSQAVAGTTTASEASVINAGIGAEGAPASASAVAGETVGGAAFSVVGGAAAGYSAGTLAGGLVQGAENKTGPGPQVGSAIGTAAGLVIGSVIPVVGTFVGGLLGGVVGGAVGGLIGPKVKSTYSSTQLYTDANGLLAPGKTNAQNYNAAADVANLTTEIDAVNSALKANNIKISQQALQIGINNPGGYQQPGKYGSLDAAFGTYKFTADDPNLNDKLSQQNFTSVAQFTNFIAVFDQAQAAVKKYLTDTTTLLATFGKTTGSLNDSIANVNTSFDQSIANGESIKATGDLSLAQTQQLTDAEHSLNDARAASIAKTIALANEQFYQTDETLTGNKLTAQASLSGNVYEGFEAQLYAFDTTARTNEINFKAQLLSVYGDAYTMTQGYADQINLLESSSGEQRLAIVKSNQDQINAAVDNLNTQNIGFTSNILSSNAAISGKPADAQASDLYTFDSALPAKRTAFSNELISIYGQSYTSTVAYASEMALEEQAFGQERLAIVSKYATAATAATEAQAGAAAQTVSSISAYISKLTLSNASPLSPRAQYGQAASDFSQNTAGALRGNYTDITNETSLADAFLTASRAVNGSGTQYASDYEKVLDALTSISAIPPDTLTASVYAAQTETQTATLVSSLASLQTELVAIKLELKQNSSTPAQIAA